MECVLALTIEGTGEAQVRATDLSACDYDPREAEACAEDAATAACEPAAG